MNIAFCVNRLGLFGLGATVTSLIRNCTAPEKLQLYFLCAYISQNDKSEIVKLLTNINYFGKYTFIDFDPIAIFSSFKSLHGDWTPYGRLLLSELLDVQEVLYLDSDLVIEVNVLELNNFNFGNQVLAAVHGGYIRSEYEYDFYINKIGLSPSLESFNSGVLLLNLNEWRLQQIKDKCFEFAEKFSNDLMTADQTILNALFAGNFAKLPIRFNAAWPADKNMPEVAGKAVLHFTGSPKPWDLFGHLIHKGYAVWKSYSNESWESHFFKPSFSILRRTWHLRRSYVRILKGKLKRIND